MSMAIYSVRVDQTVKNLPAMWETWVQSLGQENPLEEGLATHSSILAWRIPRTEEPGGYSSQGLKESATTERVTHKHRRIMAQEPYLSSGLYLCSQ